MGSLIDSVIPEPWTMGQQQTGLGLHRERYTQRDPCKAQGTEERVCRPEVRPADHTHSSTMETKWGGCFNRGLRSQTV